MEISTWETKLLNNITNLFKILISMSFKSIRAFEQEPIFLVNHILLIKFALYCFILIWHMTHDKGLQLLLLYYIFLYFSQTIFYCIIILVTSRILTSEIDIKSLLLLCNWIIFPVLHPPTPASHQLLWVVTLLMMLHYLAFDILFCLKFWFWQIRVKW